MPHADSEHGLRVQLATALRERDEQKARADAAEAELEAATATNEDEQAAHQETLDLLAAARREVERLRRDLWGYAAELNAASEAGEWERVWDVRDRMKIGARIENALAAPGDGEEGT